MFVVDSSESELGILDLIQVFVETLDKCFENVCELDLIFHVSKVYVSHVRGLLVSVNDEIRVYLVHLVLVHIILRR